MTTLEPDLDPPTATMKNRSWARIGRAREALWAMTGALLFCLVAPASALDPTRSIHQYAHAWYQEQLPQNTVMAIVQRRDGSMWFGTYEGLARHSGDEFRVIKMRKAGALRSIAVRALLEDDAGTLWIGTLNGGLYRLRADETEPESVPVPATVGSIFAIVQDARGALWFGTDASVMRLDASGIRLFGEHDGIPRVAIRAMTADSDGGVWVAMDAAGVAHFNDGALKIYGLAEGLPDLGVWSIHADRAGVVWVGTQSGLARHRDGRFESVPEAGALVGKRISAMHGDRDGNLWLAADVKGLCRLSVTEFECASNIEGLGRDIVRSIGEDREGSLWIGGTNSGVHRISDAKLATAVGATLESSSVRAVYEDITGTLWVGSDGAGLSVLDGFTLLPYAHNSRLPSAIIRALHGDARGDLWVGTSVGLSRVEPSGRISNFHPGAGLPGTTVFAIASDQAGGLWLGTLRGLARPHAERFEMVEAVGANDIRSLHFDRDGRLWIGQSNGLQCLRGGQVDLCGTPDGLPNTSVFAFHEESMGTMWLGTSSGLLRMRDGRLTRYTEREGLADDVVFAILDDGAGHFWTSSNSGIARLAKADFMEFDNGTIPRLRPHLFGKKDGMLSNQANGASQSPAVRGRDGRLWFATPRGVTMVDTNQLGRNELPPLVAVERVFVDTVERNPRRMQRIGPAVDRLEFHYAAMSYISPDAVRYRYRLAGMDADWVDAGARRVAYYTGLRPGDYTFQVIAANNDGVWNSQGDSVAFSIMPRYYETSWFRALLALLATIALVSMYRVRVWRLRANERELMRVVAERTDTLREANAELTRLAAHDGLTRIANRSAFDAALENLWEDHRQRGASLAVIMCDIDYFKAYNDTYGHQAGDAALIRVAAALQAQARFRGDVAARYGGEEFALLLANLSPAEATAAATRMVEAVRQLGIPHRTSNVAPHITLSVGVTTHVPDARTSAEQAVLAADQALYCAKNQGRDRVVAAKDLD